MEIDTEAQIIFNRNKAQQLINKVSMLIGEAERDVLRKDLNNEVIYPIKVLLDELQDKINS